jgi:hypothetical protein
VGGLWPPAGRRRALAPLAEVRHDHPEVIVDYVIFFLAGLGFGYAAPGMTKWVPLLFPFLLSLITVFKEGIDGTLLARLLLALLITAAGVLIGVLIDRRSRRSGAAGYA